MRLNIARFGGAALLVGALGAFVAVALVVAGLPIGMGGDGTAGLVFEAALVVVALGCGLMAIAGQGPVRSPAARIGLGLAAGGAVTLLVAAIAGPLGLGAEAPFYIQAFVGTPLTLLGWLLLGVAMARGTGLAKQLGRMLTSGIAIIPVLFVVANLGGTRLQFAALAAPLAMLVLVLLIGALGGIGYLALSDRWSWRAAPAD